MPDRRFVLAGSSGLLGTSFSGLIPPVSRADMPRDLVASLDRDAMARYIERVRPSTVINCVADTDVEGAEAAPLRSHDMNTRLPSMLAGAAAAVGATFVHFSSTGCYGSWKETPYDEGDPLRPTTVHHRSKAAGEEAVLAVKPDALILRLGWLFGGRSDHRKNFVQARLREARAKDRIGSNPAQFGNPTFSDDVARQVLRMLEDRIGGVFNCVNAGGPVSRLRYVTEIMSVSGVRIEVEPVEFARRAPVSHNEAAVNRRLAVSGIDIMPDWAISLGHYVRSLLN